MLKIYIVDESATSRSNILVQLEKALVENTRELLPSVDLKMIPPQELRFREVPDIIVFGEELSCSGHNTIGKVRELFPKSALLARIPESKRSLEKFDQLAKLGVRDVISPLSESSEILHRIILHSHGVGSQSRGSMILVFGGKGGVGTTSIVASLGEIYESQGLNVTLVDLDSTSQSLTRFLQVKPFINENLQLLLEGSRPVIAEFVEQVRFKVWESGNLHLVSPIGTTENLDSAEPPMMRRIMDVFQLLDEASDVVIVDASTIRGAARRLLIQLADISLVVTNNDPASLFSASSHINRIKMDLPNDFALKVVENNAYKQGVRKELFIRELESSTGISELVWEGTVPYCKRSKHWPGSGCTSYSLAGKPYRAAIKKLSEDVADCLEIALPRESQANLVLTKLLKRPGRLLLLPGGGGERNRENNRISVKSDEEFAIGGDVKIAVGDEIDPARYIRPAS